MTITVDYSPADMDIITEQAKAGNTSVEEFVRATSSRAARNAAYLAKLDRARQEIREGKVVTFTDEEWEKFVNAQNIQ